MCNAPNRSKLDLVVDYCQMLPNTVLVVNNTSLSWGLYINKGNPHHRSKAPYRCNNAAERPVMMMRVICRDTLSLTAIERANMNKNINERKYE